MDDKNCLWYYEEHELNLNSKPIQKPIVTMIFKNDKINLLKSNSILSINGEYGGKKRFLIISIIAPYYCFCFRSRWTCYFFESIIPTFREGKISRVLFEQILNEEILKSERDGSKHLSKVFLNFYQNLNS
jgi:hypothetical protein